MEEELDKDYEALDETAEEWGEDQSADPLSESDRAAIEAEIADLDGFARLARPSSTTQRGSRWSKR